MHRVASLVQGPLAVCQPLRVLEHPMVRINYSALVLAPLLALSAHALCKPLTSPDIDCTFHFT